VNFYTMNPESHAEVLGRLAALEVLVAQSLALGLAPLRNRADFVEELRLQFHAKLDRLPADTKPHAISCSDRVLYAGLAAAEQFMK
jgi:hypothetical protein